MDTRNTSRRRVLQLAVAGVLAPFGCGRSTPQLADEPLRIAAASDLEAVLPRIIEQYSRDHPGKIEPTFGASGQLTRQIEQGAPIDLFLSADRGFVDKLAARDLIDSRTIRPYAIGSLVLVARADLSPAPKELADLLGESIAHIAIANPDHAPYGRAAREALKAANLWDVLEPRIVRAESVRQALQFVQSGNAEAGLVGRALVGGTDLHVMSVDPSLYTPLVQALGIVTASKQAERAHAFGDFLLADEAQAIFAEHGFRRPDSTS